MASGATVDQIQASMHIHPAMSELIPRVLSNLK
jgi:pyruvate/2-oxoglutarate dehydrogenase complex dihydrolipoamide dehydrogenase (E3) component